MSNVAGIATIQADPDAENAGNTWSLPVYPRGALATRAVLFTVAGTPTAPTAVTVTVYAPDSTTQTPTPNSPSTGAYNIQVDTSNTNGRWVVRWIGTGACQAAVEDVFWVQSAE